MQSVRIKHSYIPLHKQSLFHLSGSKYRLYIGAWRAGKSYAGCQEAFKQSMLYKDNCGLIGRKDFTDLRDTTIETFFSVAPPETIQSYNKSEHILVFKNGSRVLFRELKDGIGLGSLNLGWFYIDEAEQVNENVFKRLKGRLSLDKTGRQCGWLTSNPPNEGHWLHEIFVKQQDPDHAIFYASTYENKEHLPAGYIQDLEKLPLSWRKKYLMGQFGFTPDGKPFYSGYIQTMHSRQLQFIKDRPVIRSWDYGFHHPACVFHQIDPKGRWLILKEHMGQDVTIQEYGTFIKTMSKEWFPGVQFADVDFGDPAGDQKSDKSEKTSVEILASLGITVISKSSTYRERKEIIERKLTTLIDGLPSLLVDDSCKIINDGFMGGYHYPERKANQAYNPKLFEAPYSDGYYEHCLSGETKIRTLNGWHCIRELVGRDFMTYAYDSFSKRLVPAKARDCRKTKNNVELWRLELDEGELTATPDHLIMMRNGSFTQLKDLKKDDELMPFYEKNRGRKEGHKIIHLNDGSIVDEHRYIYNWFNGNLRQGYHIHHIDNTPTNNYPDNLQQILAREHMECVYAKMRKHPTNIAMRNGSLNPWTPECREKMRRHMKLRWELGGNPICMRKDKLCDICSKIYSGLLRQRYCKDCHNKARSWRERQQLAEKVNHKVKSVNFYGYGDTYNFEIDVYHNFVADGLLVHNCMNSVEYFAVNMFQGAESKQDSTDIIVRTIGPMKDIKIEYEEEETNRSNYRLVTQGRYEDE